ncbi:MAG: formyltransferase family protein [Luteibaculaceae bacterium]
MKKVVFLTTRTVEIKALVASFNKYPCIFVENLAQLEQVFEQEDLLIVHNTNQIIPKQIIEKASLAVNVHSASPEFPGRDPHHWAIYRAATQYGATLHIITAQVDAGAILNTKLFTVEPSDTPKSLLQKANVLALQLITEVLLTLEQGLELKPNGMVWGKTKTKRSDFKSICDVTVALQDPQEIARRIKAFHVEGFSNLYVQIGNHKFYYQA